MVSYYFEIDRSCVFALVIWGKKAIRRVSQGERDCKPLEIDLNSLRKIQMTVNGDSVLQLTETFRLMPQSQSVTSFYLTSQIDKKKKKKPEKNTFK